MMDFIESNRVDKKKLAVGKESCMRHSDVNGGGLRASGSKSFQVFVKVPSQQSRSIPLNLQGSESESDLRNKVRVLVGLPQCQDKTIHYACLGKELTSVAQLKANATIEVSVALPGGSKNAIYATICTPEGADTEHSVTTTNVDINLGQAYDLFVEDYSQNSKMEYTYSYTVNGQKLVQLDKIIQDDDTENYLLWLEKSLESLGHRAGGKVIVEVTENVKDDKKGQLGGSPHVQFLQYIGITKRSVILSIQNILDQKQKEAMERFVTNNMNEEDWKIFLHMMPDYQYKNMITDFCGMEAHRLRMLMYLQKKANIWTSLSEKATKNSGAKIQMAQCVQIIGSTQVSFNMNNETDFFIAEVASQCSEQFFVDLKENTSEWIRLLLFQTILGSQNRSLLPSILEPEDFQRLNIWYEYRGYEEFEKQLDPHFQFRFILEEEYLKSEEKWALWDSISAKTRIKVWNLTMDAGIIEVFHRSKEELACPMSGFDNIVGADFAKKVFNPMLKISGQLSIQSKMRNLQRRLLNQLTVQQRAGFWAILDEEQQCVLMDHISREDKKNPKEDLAFWSLLNHDKKCQMINQLPYKGLKKLFLALNLEDKSQLISIVESDLRDDLKKELTVEQCKDLFLHSQFQLTEKSPQGSSEFIHDLLDDFKTTNNQNVPFDKMEDGYVQCIRDSRTSDYLITVQILQPQYDVNNQNYSFQEDETMRTYHLKETRRLNLKKKERNNTFRFAQNHYGQIKEQEPNLLRAKGNTKQLGIISLQQMSAEKGIWNEHSFFVENPVVFNHSHDSNPAETASEEVLFVGKNKDIFFFNHQEQDSHEQQFGQSQRLSEQQDLCLQILHQDLNPNRGERSRMTSENCQTIRVNPQSQLYDYIENGSFEMYAFGDVFQLNSVPTMIESKEDRFIVFSHCAKRQDGNYEQGIGQGPTLYFYSVNLNREVFQVKGGEALIDWWQKPSTKGGNRKNSTGLISVLANKELMIQDFWRLDRTILRSDASKFLTSADNERKNVLVISIEVDLSQINEASDNVKDFLPEWSDGKLIKCDIEKPEQATNQAIAKTIPTEKSFNSDKVKQVAILDMKDDEGLFAQRYLRKTPAKFYVHQNDEQFGYIQQFTIIFQELVSYTFAFISIEGRLDAQQQKACQQQYDEVSVQIKQTKNEIQVMGDPTGMKTEVQNAYETLRQTLAKQKILKKSIFSDAIPKYDIFKCKYIVPGASIICQSKGQNNKINTFVQVTNNNERARQMVRDNLKDLNVFEIKWYKIANIIVKSDTVEQIPKEQDIIKIQAPMSRQALIAYSNNSPSVSKFGAMKIRATAGELVVSLQSSCWYGAFIYKTSDRGVQKNMIEWFSGSPSGANTGQIKQQTQTVSVDYPLMVYKGYMPDNREIVLVNLADKENPQKILHLYDMQFICFVGHNFSSRESKIGMLCYEAGNFKLCWLIKKQPFMKQEENHVDQLQIFKYSINFNVPIMKKIGGIVKVEFVNIENSDIEASDQGALIVQTTDDLFYSNNLTGLCTKITNGNMTNITLQRGFNSYFYYGQQINDTDCVVNELCLSVLRGEWQYEVKEVMKTNEAMVIALELDPENRSQTDSIYKYNRQLIEKQEQVLNVLYIVTDKENLWKMRQKGPEETGSRYEVLKEVDLSLGKEMTNELNQYKQKPFNSMGISDRCISLNDTNFNLFNSYSWPLDVSREQDHEQEDKKGNLNLQESSDDESKDEEQNDGNSQVHSIESISWSSRQLISCSYMDEDDQQQSKISHAFVTKLHPGTRRQDLIGLRGLRDLDSLNVISNEKTLIKFRGSDLNGLTDYWSIIDKCGQIQRIPSQIKKLLTWYNHTNGPSTQKESGSTFVLRGGKKQVLSFEADTAYVEKKLTEISFTRQGEVMQVKEYKKQNYDNNLKKNIVKELVDNEELVFGKKLGLGKEEHKQITNNLQYQKEMLLTEQGDIYRIASIVDSRFHDDVAVNPEPLLPLSSKKKKEQATSDKLNMGIYCVEGKVKTPVIVERIQNKKGQLKIVLFLCKNQRARFQLDQAGFKLCKDYLCWSFPSETVVHLIRLDGMNQTEISKHGMFEDGILSFFGKKEALKKKRFSMIMSQQLKTDKDDEFFQSCGYDVNEDSEDSEDQFAHLLDSQLKEANKNQQRNSMINSMRTSNRTSMRSQITEINSNNEDESSSDDQDMKVESKIKWHTCDTKVIELDVMIENEADRFAMQLSEVPKSAKLSLIRQTGKDGFTECEPTLHNNLLQITVRDKTIIFNVDETPEERYFLNATSQFISLETYTEAGPRIVVCNEDSSKLGSGCLINYVITNRNKELCFLRQDRLQTHRGQVTDNIPKTPPIIGIFRQYTEIDIRELERIQNKIDQLAKLDNIDYQSMLGYYNGHTAFSIFANEIKFHEQANTQFTEDEFPEEVQENEQVFENNILRRMYQILTLPTPDLEKPDIAKDIIDQFGESTQQTNQYEISDESTVNQSKLDETQGTQDENQDQEEEDDEFTKVGLRSVLMKSLYDSKNTRIKDILLFIANKCNECNISAFCENQEDFAELLCNLSSNALELINESFCSTTFTEKCLNSSWNGDQLSNGIYTFRKNTSRVTQEEISDRIKTHLTNDCGIKLKEVGKTQVEVHMLDLSWLLKGGKNFVNFTSQLGCSSSEMIYETEFILTLVNEFWWDNYYKILYRCLIPWFIYAMCAQALFIICLRPAPLCLQDDPPCAKDESKQTYRNILATLVIILLIWQIRIEVKQFKYSEGILDYLWDANNCMDIYQYFSTIVIVFFGVIQVEFPALQTQRVMAAISTLFLWIKVFTWLRLFSQTSFFIKLIEETLRDIKDFIVIFFVALFMFGVPMYILGLNRTEDNGLVDEIFGSNWFLNSFYNQYMLSLGEFSIDNFGEGPQTQLCYVLFLLSTFITQITFLNMLIAIMGDSYSKVMEAQERYGLQTRIDIMVDFTALIEDADEDIDNKPYLFIVQAKSDGSDDAHGGWEGDLTVIKKSVDSGIAQIQKNFNKKLDSMTDNLQEARSRDIRIEKDSKGQYLRIMEKFKSVNEKFDEMDVEKTEQIFEIVKRSQEDQRKTAKEFKQSNNKIQQEQTDLVTKKLNNFNRLSLKANEMNDIVLKELAQLKDPECQIEVDLEDECKANLGAKGKKGKKGKNGKKGKKGKKGKNQAIEEQDSNDSQDGEDDEALTGESNLQPHSEVVEADIQIDLEAAQDQPQVGITAKKSKKAAKKAKKGKKGNNQGAQAAQDQDDTTFAAGLEAQQPPQNQALEAMNQISEQQTQLISQIQGMKSHQEQLDKTITDNSTSQSALQNDVQANQARYLGELQELKESQAQFESSITNEISRMQQVNSQRYANPQSGISVDQMASLQDLIQGVATQLTNQQAVMQQTIFEQQQADKEEIMTSIIEKHESPVVEDDDEPSESPVADDEDDDM